MITKKATCLTCGKDFTYRPFTGRSGKFCSRECYHRGQKLGLTNHKPPTEHHFTCQQCSKEFIVKGRQKLDTYHSYKYCSRECYNTAQRTGKAKRREANARALIRCKEGKTCAICGFFRFIETCHIVPASRKGEYTRENILYLCPNHHRLFDERMLNAEEVGKLPQTAQTVYSKNPSWRKRKITHKAEPSLKQRICLGCGAKFMPQSYPQLRCDKCRTKICLYCGKKFKTRSSADYRRRKFCSWECYLRATAKLGARGSEMGMNASQSPDISSPAAGD